MIEAIMTNEKSKKKIIIRWEGPIKLSTGGNAGSSASFSIPTGDPTKGIMKTEGTGEVSFGKSNDKAIGNGEVANIFRDMKEKLNSASIILERIRATQDRDNLNRELNLFLVASKGAINFLTSVENRKVFKNLGINPSKDILQNWQNALLKDDSELVDSMKDQRDIAEHQRIIRPSYNVELKLEEVVHINDDSKDKKIIKIPEHPKITSQIFFLEGKEVISVCGRYLELIEGLLSFAGKFIQDRKSYTQRAIKES